MTDAFKFDRAAFRNTPFVLKVEKPWSHELIFTPPGKP